MYAISPDQARKSSQYLRLAESRDRQAAQLRNDAERSARDGDLIMRQLLLRDAEAAETAAAVFRELHEKRVSDLSAAE